jgi:hypothetical protein
MNNYTVAKEYNLTSTKINFVITVAVIFNIPGRFRYKSRRSAILKPSQTLMKVDECVATLINLELIYIMMRDDESF